PSIVEKLLSVKPICKPGECYGYQNVMFSLIGNVILQSSGKSYAQWLRETIFAPLKMSDASLGFESMVQDENYALPHVRGTKRWYSA
ncbi:serine hydrolase domain-containing protein, partial [Pseudoalteromonas sp. RB2-MNA-CIBAN-0110]